ncbi:MAG: hypothetical protein M0R73_09435 [Dehalococcoidia bacterium]|nr:hypothetical protein [Dehalococcoidia bacterium]
MPSKSRLLLPALLMVAALFVACTSDDPDPTASPDTATTTATTTATATGEPTAPETGEAAATPAATETVDPADGSAATETRVVEYLAQPAEDGETPEATECFSESAASTRGDAWRCSIGNMIADPCFALGEGLLRCRPDPIADDAGLLVEVEEPLEERESPEDPQVWLLELSDGTVCGFQGGATAGLDGERVNYGCTNGEWILGFPEPGADGAPWTARFLAGHVGPNGLVADDLHEENIATVWR